MKYLLSITILLRSASILWIILLLPLCRDLYTQMASSASDRTVNKLAICGAIFAGVAYVGYSVVKQAFGKTFAKPSKKKEDYGALLDYESQRRGRIYLRRLSGSGISAMATEILLKNQESNGSNDCDLDGAARLIFRPLSVQERIRELNLRARQFSETVMAVQLHDGYQKPDTRSGYGHAISLQPTPTHTPRPRSPIDFTHLGSSKCSSTENLNWITSPENSVSNGYGSLRRRWSRRSSKKLKTPDFMSREHLEDCVGKEAEKLLDEREQELRRRLQGFENGTTKVLTPYEAKSLVALLHSKDCDTLERVLVTMSNSAAFTVNQDHLREAGCLVRLQHLIVHSDLAVKLAATRTAGNMALNTSNQQEMELFVPLLLLNLRPSRSDPDDESLLIQRTLSTLTNIAALDQWHSQFSPGLTRLLELSQSKNSNICNQSLRVLINLSTNESMISHLLSNKTLDVISNLLEPNSGEGPDLLRVLTLMSNLVRYASKLSVETDDNECQITSRVSSANILDVLRDLSQTSDDDEVRLKARNIVSELTKTISTKSAAAEQQTNAIETGRF